MKPKSPNTVEVPNSQYAEFLRKLHLTGQRVASIEHMPCGSGYWITVYAVRPRQTEFLKVTLPQ